jgi:S1-C subfamily serine protease
VNRIGDLRSLKLGMSLAAACGALFAIGCGGDDSEEPETLDPQAVIELSGPATAGILGEQFGTEYGGSGVVIDADQGLVLTNAHVVEGLDKLEVKLGEDPASSPARIRAVAPCDDLAVIEMLQPAAEGTELVIADRTAERGEHVTALGFPGNFESFGEESLQTTDGTVSNPGITAEEIDPSLPTYQDLVQHTAPINHGNSGGPLVDDHGEVVGINTLGDETKENQLYAIDSAYVNTILPDLVAGNDRLRMGWDIRPYDAVDLRSEFKYFRGDELANAGISAAFVDDYVRGLGLPNGMYVFWTDPGLPADKADIFGGDLIASIDGEPVDSESDVCDILQSQEPGATVQVNGYYVASTPKLNQIGDKWSVDMKLPEEEIPPPTETTTTETTTEAE